jgi:hypothetical protein
VIKLLIRLSLRSLWRDRLRLVLCLLVSTAGALVVIAGAAVVPVAERQRAVEATWQTTKGQAPPAGLWWSVSVEYYRGQEISVYRAADGGKPVLPPGVPALPQPGEMYISPEVARLLGESAVVRQRYPARVVGLIEDQALPAPRSLVVVLGTTVSEVQARGGVLITSFARPGAIHLVVPEEVSRGAPFLVVAFLLPVIWLYVVLAQMGSSARDARLSALRLVGVRDVVLRRLQLLEQLVVGVVGALLAIGLFEALGPSVGPRLPIGGAVWARDVMLPAWIVPAVLVGSPKVLMAATWCATRRALRSPLATHRRTGVRQLVGRWGLTVLAGGALSTVGSLLYPSADNVNVSLALFIVGFLAVFVGCVSSAGELSRWVARRAGLDWPRVAHLLAARHVLQSGSRAMAVGTGLTLLVLLSGCLLAFFPLFSTVDAQDLRQTARALGEETIVVQTHNPRAASALMQLPTVAGIGQVSTISTGDGRTIGQILACGTLKMRVGKEALDACDPQTRPSLRSAIFPATGTLLEESDPIMAGSDPREWLDEESVPTDGVTFLHVIVQKDAAADLEQFRNDIMSTEPVPFVQTLGEKAAEAGKRTVQFRDATMAIICIAEVAAIAALGMSLLEQVRTQQRASFYLYAAGARPRELWLAFFLQSMLIVVPAIILGSGFSCLLSSAFLKLNGGNVPVPFAAILGVAVIALLTAPLAALCTYPAVWRSSQTRPLDA